MFASRWVSLRVLIGGSFVALVTVIWGSLQWQIQHWFIYVVSAPFVFAAAILQTRRIYLYIILTYVLAHVGIDLWMKEGSFILGSDVMQWISIAVAGEIIHQISNQRRRTELLNQRRIQEMEAMNRTLTEISGELELNVLLQIITERAVRLLNATLGELLLYDTHQGKWRSWRITRCMRIRSGSK